MEIAWIGWDMEGLVTIFSADAVYDFAPGLMMRGHTEIAEGR